MNGRRVDINRNFDIHFGVHPPEYLPSEEYEGTAAFSEPEARVTRDAAESLLVQNGGPVGAILRSRRLLAFLKLPVATRWWWQH